MTIDPDVRGVAAHFGLDPLLVQAVVNAEGNIVRAVLPALVTRHRNRLIGRHASTHAHICGVRIYADRNGGVFQDHPLAVQYDEDVLAGISRLLCARRPLAVVWLVIAVHVDALKRISRRARSHIAQKCREVTAPRLAHLNTPAAVVAELFCATVSTTTFRMLPRNVFTRLSRSVRSSGFARTFSAKAAATFGATMSKRRARYDDAVSAIAGAVPMSLRFSMRRDRLKQHDESAEALRGDVVSAHIDNFTLIAA